MALNLTCKVAWTEVSTGTVVNIITHARNSAVTWPTCASLVKWAWNAPSDTSGPGIVLKRDGQSPQQQVGVRSGHQQNESRPPFSPQWVDLEKRGPRPLAPLTSRSSGGHLQRAGVERDVDGREVLWRRGHFLLVEQEATQLPDVEVDLVHEADDQQLHHCELGQLKQND